MISAATSSSAESTASSASGSLNGTWSVRAATSGRTPAESGMPSVVAPDPALIRTPSWAPWNPPSTFTIPLFPEKPRASRIAAMVASDPVETNRTCSMDGWSAMISRARSSSSGVGVP